VGAVGAEGVVVGVGGDAPRGGRVRVPSLGVTQHQRRSPKHARLRQRQRNLQCPRPRAEISARSARQKDGCCERSQADGRQDQDGVVRVRDGEAGAEFDDVSCLAGGEADEVLQEDDVLQSCGEGCEEELEFCDAVDGEGCCPVDAGE
jgi:hypothetical protein